MRKSLIGLMLGIVLCFGNVQEVKAVDGMDGLLLAELCAASTADGQKTSSADMACTMFINGVVNGYSIGLLTVGMKDDLCTPASSTGVQWALVVDKWFKENPEHRFKKAEIRRNLGDLEGCLKYLSDLPEGYDWVAKQIKREVKKKNTKLFKIKQAPLPKTMTA